MRGAVIIVVLSLLCAACSENDGAEPTLAPGPTSATSEVGTTPGPTSSQPTEDSSATSTSSSSTSTTSPPATGVPIVPLPDPNEEDLAIIWQQLMEYHNWAFANPELADPTDYLADSCDCLERAVAILAEYLDNGWSAVGEGIIVHSVEVEVESSTFALMTVVDEQAELTILGSGGEVVEVIERRPKTFFDVRVRKTEDGWRIAEWNQRGAEGAAE